MTDKEIIIEMLKRAGYKVEVDEESSWRAKNVVGIENINCYGHEDGSVGFSFNPDDSLCEVWGRDW